MQTRIGTSGLEISPVVVGGMSFGDPATGSHTWTLPLDQARPLIRAALDLGLTTFDTANVYSLGSGEEILGTVLAESARRADVQIFSKVHGRMRPGANGGGLGRVHILNEIDATLRRLKTDYLDLYQIHRWDSDVPIEETMEALHDVVRSGKARYIGASSMFAWQFMTAQHAADLGGWTRFISMQDQYNLLNREDEREMHAYCLHAGVGVLPWSPLARGRLTRDWDDAGSVRSGTDAISAQLYRQNEESDRRIVDAVAQVADELGTTRAQVALAWVLQRPAVSAPIVGATRITHLEDAVAATDLTLDAAQVARLEENYTPHAPEGF